MHALDRAAVVLLALHDALRPLERYRLWRAHPRYEDLARLSQLDVERTIGRAFVRSVWEPAPLQRLVAAAVRELERPGYTVLVRGDDSYPGLLESISDPPAFLFVRGVVDLLNERSVAIVGTRRPTPSAVVAARRLAAEAVSAGWVVSSGLAFGCDVAAHAGMLHAGGRGVVVLGTGIDNVTPRTNRGLAAGIVGAGGVLVSEYPPGAPVRKFNFPARNRIITGLSVATIIMQAPQRSGALFSAEFALDQGRAVYVHRVGLEMAGSAALAQSGAPVIDHFTEVSGDEASNAIDAARDMSVIAGIFGPALTGGSLAAARRALVESIEGER